MRSHRITKSSSISICALIQLSDPEFELFNLSDAVCVLGLKAGKLMKYCERGCS